MDTPKHTPRGTTHLKLPLDVVRPSGVLSSPTAAPHASWHWLRPLLIVAATLLALALLIGAATYL